MSVCVREHLQCRVIRNVLIARLLLPLRARITKRRIASAVPC